MLPRSPAVTDAARSNDRHTHCIDDLRNQSHCADHARSRATAEAAAMPAGLKSLGNDNVGAALFERAGFGDCGSGTENDAADFLQLLNGRGLGQTKVKADGGRPELEDEVEQLCVEAGKKIFWLRHRPQSKCAKIGRKPRPHAHRRLGANSRGGVGKKIQIEGPVRRLAHRRNLLPHHIRWLSHATDRPHSSGIATVATSVGGVNPLIGA